MSNNTRSALEHEGTEFSSVVSDRVNKIIVSPIKEMRLLAQHYNDVISFGQGIPYPDTAIEIKKKLAKILLEKDISKYSITPGIIELRMKLAEKLKTYGVDADPKKEILVSVGGMEAIYCAIMAIVNPGDEVIMFTPGFSSHIEQVLLAGGVPKYSMLKKDGWKINIEDFRSQITDKTKAVIINNPSNPTGTVFSEKELRQIAAICIENNIMVILDDPYNFLLFEDTTFFCMAAIKGLKKNMIACFSFSKEYALTGYRLGYVYAAEGMINQLMKVHDASCICAPVISQYAGIVALESPQRIVENLVGAMKRNRELIMTELDKIPGLSYVPPKGAYYIFVKYEKDMESVPLAVDILKKVQVTVVPGSAFGPAGEGHIRLSFAGRPELIVKGMERLRKYFEEN
ncbi:MAG: pyridoxal phosphate-dependent aminotransferase [Nanoarchaeota archaeon]|nr:pyridoxal phosphate-dependent aminotransferase [Nanoarchaeota archaeon]